jgi:hypothetical protein
VGISTVETSRSPRRYTATVPGQRRKPSRETHPFLFLGAGLGTTRKCLECQICFVRAPLERERAAIEGLLPPALTYTKTWAGAVLNFGSDDSLEVLVSGRQRPNPTRAEWTAFCEDVERRMLEIHHVAPIGLFVKHDDGTYGRKLGPWHEWSVREIATRFHELEISSTVGPELAGVCTSILIFLAASRSATAALEPAARSRLVAWSTKLVAVAGHWQGKGLVDSIVSLLPPGEALSPDLTSALLAHPTRKLALRLGGVVLVERAAALLSTASTATPDRAEEILETLLEWMILDEFAGRKIAEALLATGSLKAAVEERSATVREGFARKKPTGKGSPSVTLFAQASYLLETHEPARALENIELGLRFPHPHARLYGLQVRALQGVGQASRAEHLAQSDVVQRQAGPEQPGVFYEVARYYLSIGRFAEAVDQLRLYLEHEPRNVHTLRYDPRFKALHALPEFAALL